MARIFTGNRRITVEVSTNAQPTKAPNRGGNDRGDESDDKDGSTPYGQGLDTPLSKAKAETADAMQKQSELEQQEERDKAAAQAEEATKTAKGWSDKATKTKVGTPTSAKAHKTAALAHRDAADAWKSQSGSKSGNDLAARQKAKERTAAHTEFAEHHEKMSSGALASKAAFNSRSGRIAVFIS